MHTSLLISESPKLQAFCAIVQNEMTARRVKCIHSATKYILGRQVIAFRVAFGELRVAQGASASVVCRVRIQQLLPQGDLTLRVQVPNNHILF